MKRIFAMLLAALMLFALVACEQEGTQETVVTEPVETEEVVPVTQEPGEDLETVLNGMVEGPVEAVIEYFGEPEWTDYASSCLGPGDDGELHYPGFTIYTFRYEGGEDVLEYVLEDNR